MRRYTLTIRNDHGQVISQLNGIVPPPEYGGGSSTTLQSGYVFAVHFDPEQGDPDE